MPGSRPADSVTLQSPKIASPFWSKILAIFHLRILIRLRREGTRPASPRKDEVSQMTSKRQIEANRANATKSTGPRTIKGKARSSRNAYRHGLSSEGDNERPRLEALSMTLAAEAADKSRADAAKDLARARHWLADIRQVRLKMLTDLMNCTEPHQMKQVAGLNRYEKAARARQRRGLKRLRATAGNEGGEERSEH